MNITGVNVKTLEVKQENTSCVVVFIYYDLTEGNQMNGMCVVKNHMDPTKIILFLIYFYASRVFFLIVFIRGKLYMSSSSGEAMGNAGVR